MTRALGATTVFGTLLRHAERDADRTALTGIDGSWTYGALCDDAATIASGLLERGLVQGDRYAIVAGNHASVCVAWLAGARSGLVPVLLNSLLTVPELEVAIRQVDPRLVMTDCAHLDTVAGALRGAGARPTVLLDGTSPGTLPFAALRTGRPCRVALPDADDLFEIALTSGTTSASKMVALTHGAEARHWSAVARALGLTAADVTEVVAPLFHSSGIRNGAFLMWAAGGAVDVAPRFSASGFWSDMGASGATWTCLVETMLVFLVNQSGDDVRPGLRFVIGGGRPELLDQFEQRFGVRVVQGYGMTECGFPVITPPSVSLSDVRSSRRFQPGALLAGRPIEGCDVRVVSAGLDVPDGQAGEIWVRSSQLLTEYVGDPAATESAFAAGWLRTGDRGVIGPHGDLYFLGRLRDVVRRGGENFASSEVEQVIEAHPDVARCAVVGVPDDTYGQEVKAFVVASSSGISVGQLQATELWDWCRGRLAKHKLPRFIEFLDELPVSGSGRVRKDVLRSAAPVGGASTFDRTIHETTGVRE